MVTFVGLGGIIIREHGIGAVTSKFRSSKEGNFIKIKEFSIMCGSSQTMM